MTASIRPDLFPKEDRTPEIDEVLEGRDTIALDGDLLEEDASKLPPTDPPRTEPLVVRLRSFSVPARIKLALTGGKEARQLLGRDPVRLVQLCVLLNPRVTLEEVVALAKNRSAHGDLLRQIANQRDWVRQYSVRLALVLNPKTPLQVSLGLLSAIQARDIRHIAKSKNVPSVVQAQARRMLLRRGGSESSSS